MLLRFGELNGQKSCKLVRTAIKQNWSNCWLLSSPVHASSSNFILPCSLKKYAALSPVGALLSNDSQCRNSFCGKRIPRIWSLRSLNSILAIVSGQSPLSLLRSDFSLRSGYMENRLNNLPLVYCLRTLGVTRINSLLCHYIQFPHLLVNKNLPDFKQGVGIDKELLKGWCVYVMASNSAKYIEQKLLGKFEEVVNRLCELQCWLRRRIFIQSKASIKC